jgi:hypothetical protein
LSLYKISLQKTNNHLSDYDENYLQSLKNVALKPKRAKIGIPTK